MKKRWLFIFMIVFIFAANEHVSQGAELADETWEFWNRRYTKKIINLLEKGETIVLAVIGGKFACSPSLIPDRESREAFLERYVHDSLNTYTIALASMDFFANHSNFAVVDRLAVEKILEEHKFQQTGFVTKEMRGRLGEMLGVTHLLVVSSIRDFGGTKQAGYRYTDADSLKLIDISLGKILTMETAYSHKIDDRSTKWTTKAIFSTNIADYEFMYAGATQKKPKRRKYRKPHRYSR